MEDLHHAHAALHQSPCEQCRMGVGAGFGGVGAVHLQRGLALVAEVCEVRHARLHAKGHLVLRNARLCLGIAKAFESLLVQLPERVEHRAPVTGIYAGRVLHVQNRIATAAQFHAIVFGRQKPAGPHAREERLAGVLDGGGEHHK